MEDIHGVDVSWLHHSNRDLSHRPALSSGRARAPPAPGLAKDTPPPVSHQNGASNGAPSGNNNGKLVTPDQRPTALHTNSHSSAPTSPAPVKSTPKRPGLLGRNSQEKLNGQGSPDNAGKTTPRRNSWMSKISSNFNSGSPQQQNTSSPQNGGGSVPAQIGKQGPNTPPARKTEVLEPYTPQPPKTANTSFFSNALRRLSSNSALGGPGKMSGGTVCPRRVLNVDPNRPRCLLPELDQAKLRKVAFCVDVEIAGGPRYKDEADGCERKKKQKEKKQKERGEGEALKHPQQVLDVKEKTGVVETESDMGLEGQESPDLECQDDEKKDLTKKKEKKKRSEEERKERKEQKRRKAEESGAIPVHIVRDSADSLQNTPPGTVTPRPTDRPTTDPLRIYRRCCQLRESPILKRISDQLQKPSVCPVATPGVVSVLDLTGSRLQFADIMTLSDWLAIVPVKKLILEDSDLTDEGIRVILAGLLASRPLDYPLRRSQAHHEYSEMPDNEERTGVIEKLSLKNNPKISKEGWKHIALFIYMCKSLKSLDISMINFPSCPVPANQNHQAKCKPDRFGTAEIMSKAISERLGGDRLEELIMAECTLEAEDIRRIVDGVTICGIKRLGLAGNQIDDQGLEHVVRYIRSGVCQGLDLGGNDMQSHFQRLIDAIHPQCSLWALSLADCNLTPASLKPLFPALAKLANLRFLDLSHNHDLFSKQPSALGCLRKYLPLLPTLRRLHLTDVSMTPAQAIALAEVLPESSSLAHLNILQNPQLSALASATDEETQEEACALYASLMAAARVSRALICIDIDVPTSDNSGIVKALAKQVVAYCLRNMETFAAMEGLDTSGSTITNLGEVDVPEVLLHLVGNYDGQVDPHPDELAPDRDYIVGGTGVVKALSYCLSEKASELRRGSYPTSGATTPLEHDHHHDLSAAKAKQMSKNLLESARKVRSRLQPALVREAKAADDMSYRRLLFLDNTLQGMIQRFEDEYPECRITPPRASPSTDAEAGAEDDAASTISSAPNSLPATSPFSISTRNEDSLSNSATLLGTDSDVDDDEPSQLLRLSRHNSDVSLAARALSIEEGHVHRMGQKVQRELLSSPRKGPVDADGQDPNFGLLGDVDEFGNAEDEPEHLKILRMKLASLGADELRDSVLTDGWENVADEIIEKDQKLQQIEQEHPGRLVELRKEFAQHQ